MRLFLWANVFALCLSAAAGQSDSDWPSVKTQLIKQTINRQWIPMRDGVKLDANIYLPRAGQAPYPTILIRSPYPSDLFHQYATQAPFNRLLAQGYAVVFQNERGRYWSQGQASYLGKAKADGYDTVDWISRQAWSNGKIGTFGCSSSAENQLGLSVANHPAHKAAIALAPGAGIGKIGPYWEQGNIYRGGALQLWAPGWFNDYLMYGGQGAHHRPQFPSDLSQAERTRLAKQFALGPSAATLGQPRQGLDYRHYFKHLPVSALNRASQGGLTDWDDFARRSPADPAWADTHFVNEGDTFHVPMLWFFSWYDLAVAPNVALFNHIDQHPKATGERAKGKQFMRIGPNGHCAFSSKDGDHHIGARNIGPAGYDYAQQAIDWFDYWLKDRDNGVLLRPKVQYYDLGAQRWQSAPQFPPADSHMLALYLHSQGRANSLFGDGQLRVEPPRQAAVDSFTYDPQHPVPTLGGGSCCMGDLPDLVGSFDQRPIEARQDVLVYSSEPLREALSVAGFIEAEIYIASTAKDTDITLKLIDVHPDGSAYNLDDTIFRLRYRDGYDQPTLMTPGQVYRVRLPPMITSNQFQAGHRIRLEISASNFPRYERNLNTGGNNYDETQAVVAENQIHHSPRYPSQIRLPVSPAP